MHGDSQRILPLAAKAMPRSKRRRTEAEHPVDDVTAWDKAIEAHQLWQQRAECPIIAGELPVMTRLTLDGCENKDCKCFKALIVPDPDVVRLAQERDQDAIAKGVRRMANRCK